MKTIFTFLLTFLLSGTLAFSQGNDTLLFMDFNDTLEINANIYIGPPNGNDTIWINFDADQLPDGSPNNRPGEWFWYSEGFSTIDTTGIFASNSWLLGNPPKADNWLMTPPIFISDTNATLYWESAPFQTPLYLDGYEVLVSTTDNFESSFTDTLMLFAEYLGRTTTTTDPEPGWTNYIFSDGYVHGLNGTYTEADTTTTPPDSARLNGILEPHTISLAQYAGQTIYIAFHHSSEDDNLLSIDNILVTGSVGTGIAENGQLSQFGIFPNPASDVAKIVYDLKITTPVITSLFDINGKLVKELSRSVQMAGTHYFNLDVKNLAPGAYFIELKSPHGSVAKKLIVE